MTNSHASEILALPFFFYFSFEKLILVCIKKEEKQLIKYLVFLPVTEDRASSLANAGVLDTLLLSNMLVI